MATLDSYHRKRDPAGTPEPFSSRRSTGGSIFVIHKHAARQLHYDLRLEVNGSLWSWAVPRGPSPDPSEKRLAVHVEPHPVDYAYWEGTIPEGNYGAGAMIIWDRGQWIPLLDPIEGLAKGKLLFELQGFKLFGKWTLVQTKRADGKDWLLIKERDGWVGRIPNPPADSVVSGLTVEQLKSGEPAQQTLAATLKQSKAARLEGELQSVRPMLCEKSEPFDRSDWLFEIKYDGYRVLAEKNGKSVRLRSRNGNDLSNNFPEVTESVATLPYDHLVLDGEIVCLGPDGLPNFQRLQQRARLQRTTDVQYATLALPASFFVFDLPIVEGFDLRDQALRNRKAHLQSLLPSVGVLRYVDHFEQQGKQVYQHAVQMRLEGLVGKDSASKYVAGRSRHWLKIAALRTDDFAIIGYLPPKPSDREFKAVLLAQLNANEEWIYMGRAGSGLDGPSRKALAARFESLAITSPKSANVDEVPTNAVWLAPELVVEIRYKNVTEAGNLRQPVLLRHRDDKPANECRLRDDEHVLAMPAEVERQAERPRVILSNQDKIFWPKGGRLTTPVSKGQLINHHERIATWLLPWLKDRPVVLTRYPDGIDGKSFFQHQAPAFLPSWIRTEKITKSDHDEIDYIVIDDFDSLQYIINLGAIPLHVWSARIGKLQYPDYCILDLDPKDAPIQDTVAIAHTIHQLCEGANLPNVVKTSGGDGLHILIPLSQRLDHVQATTLAELLARLAVQKLPDIATIQRSIELREGRVYIDYLQNGFGKTIASPFCARPLPGAPVSMPLRWSEVTSKLDPKRFHVRNAGTRLKRLSEDPCAPALGACGDLELALATLAEAL